ncbi:hypothetical protein EV190_101800 [Actinorugispora endophytica]|uniref:Uncharacterized protein n=1 Tax=Actinorugispora endophytica TaxID=1605990 RepID=A0A4R6V551_9ACTN|nr:hypothetical protein EV190_101800 [Actinorugispora endophytica]
MSFDGIVDPIVPGSYDNVSSVRMTGTLLT